MPSGNNTNVKKLVAVVEDHPLTRRLIARVLRNSGCRVEEFSAPVDALGRIRRGVDVLVTDIELPVVRGCDFAAMVKKDRPDLRVVGVSGGRCAHDCARCQNGTPFDCFLNKPFSFGDLLDAVGVN